jgi:hypothetical protein
MGQAPVSGSDGDDPLAQTDPMTDEEWAALSASRWDEVPPPDLDEHVDSEPVSPMAGLADGGELDTAPPELWLAAQLEAAAGPDGRYAGASDDEAAGAVAGWDRIASYAAARKYEALAALIRQRPAPGHAARRPEELPGLWEEFTGTEVAHLLHQSRYEGNTLVETAYDLAGKLAATMAGLLAGRLDDNKTRIIQRGLAHLDEAEAARVQDMILGRAGQLTPAGLRSAVGRAVMEVAPDKAKARREAAARTRAVELRAEDSGNAQLAARELDPAVAKAIDAELTERATELKRAGIGDDMQDRRVLALMERFGLAGDLPPSPRSGAGTSQGPAAAGGGLVVPGRLNITVPLSTLADTAERPGELSGFGPVDPDLARRLGGAALRSAATAVCVTVTDEHGLMTGHGCARRPTRKERDIVRKAGRDSPAGVGLTPFPGQDGRLLRDGNGLWVLDPGDGRDMLIVRIWPVGTDPCDHRLHTAAHDPGKELRHLAELRYGSCTGPVCRRPARQCDFEHNTPWEYDGETCLCNGNPKCRFEHRIKQHPHWTVTQYPDGRIGWRAPTGRTATTEPHRFPI